MKLCHFQFCATSKCITHAKCFLQDENIVLTFTAATLYAPLFLISLLYLPTIIYIIGLGIKFYGLKRWLFETLNNPVFFIFPILTNMSFYGEQTQEENSNPTSGDSKMCFSIKQSNILYFLSLFGSGLCILLDILIQLQRKGDEKYIVTKEN